MSEKLVPVKSKILILGKLPPPYIGPSVATQLILNSKLKEEFDLIHLDTSDHRDINTLGALDFQNFYLAFKHYLLLIRAITRHQPDLVYMPTGQTTISYARDAGFILISKLLGRNVLGHLRGGNFRSWYNSANPLIQLLVRKIHSLVDGQIVLGNNLKGLFSWLMSEDKIFVIPNGGDYPRLPQDNFKNSRNFRVLYLSNFQRTKGVLETLKAASAVYRKHQNVEFVFAGSWRDDKTKTDFQQFVKAHSELPVTCMGAVTGKDKFRLLASASVFVLPTYYPNEGHPWVIVEAMSYGLPIISTNHAAIPECVRDGVNGYIVNKRNAHQIAERINYLIENPLVRKQMGSESRRFYLENFTEGKMVARLSQAFRKVIFTPRRSTDLSRSDLGPQYSCLNKAMRHHISTPKVDSGSPLKPVSVMGVGRMFESKKDR